MFQEKNYEILKKKLDLDINNNADSLNHTMSNFIDLKAIGLTKYILEVYNNSNIKYDEEKVKELIDKEAETLKEIFLKHIKNRQEQISSFFNADVDFTKITDIYLDEYHEHIDNLTDTLEENIKLDVLSEICTNFSETIVKLYKLPDEISKENLIEYINNSYCNSLIEKIKSEATLRNATLKNLSKEAFERFKSMNAKTVD